MAAAKVSAGILMHRERAAGVEVLLAHPGGPLWKNRDEGWWTIPKGAAEAGEDLLAAARREFAEETGVVVEGAAVSFAPVRQKGGKTVHAWAVRGDVDPVRLASNTFEMEWPPRSGRTQRFPEIDRIEWFPLEHARRKILPALVPLLDELERLLARDRVAGAGANPPTDTP